MDLSLFARRAQLLLVALLAACATKTEPVTPANPLTGAPFVGTTWRLTAFVEGDQERPPVEGPRITIYFNGRRYSGSTSCNQYRGEYTLEGSTVRLGPTFVTEKDCPGPGIMEQERRFLGIMRENPTFVAGVSEDQLILDHEDGALIFAAGWTSDG